MQTLIYWIHYPEHNDIMTQRYIGVSNSLSRRKACHLANLRHNHHDNIHLQRAFNINNQFLFTPILKGNDNLCYILEEYLRPHRSIGWNINKGGFKPPAAWGQQYAKGCKGPIKPTISPDGKLFSSRKEAALFYNVDVTTIQNWIKNPEKPWEKCKISPSKSIKRYNIKQEGLKRCIKIHTPKGIFNSIRETALYYKVVHGTINYWLKTNPTEFYRIT